MQWLSLFSARKCIHTSDKWNHRQIFFFYSICLGQVWYQTQTALDFNLDESSLSQCKASEQMAVCTGSVRSSTMPSCHEVWSQLTANHHHVVRAKMLQFVLGKAKKVNQM